MAFRVRGRDELLYPILRGITLSPRARGGGTPPRLPPVRGDTQPHSETTSPVSDRDRDVSVGSSDSQPDREGPPPPPVDRTTDGGRSDEAATEAPPTPPADAESSTPREPEAPTESGTAYVVDVAQCPRSFRPLSQRQATVLREFTEMVQQAAVVTRSPLLQTIALHPLDFAAHAMVESNISFTARGRERPHRDDPMHRDRWSYGLIQVIDTNLRGLYGYRRRLGSLADRVPEPPPRPADGWDSGIEAWRESAATREGAWYAILFLLRFEDWLVQYFDERALFASGELRASTRELTGGAEVSRLEIIEFFNHLDALPPQWMCVLRLFGAASSLGGMRNVIRSGHWGRSLGCLQKAWIAIHGSGTP